MKIFSDNDEEGSHGSPQREEGESPDDAEGGGTAQPAPVVEEESSEDEMVFEAYVSPLDVSADQEDSVLCDEDVKVLVDKYLYNNSLDLTCMCTLHNIPGPGNQELIYYTTYPNHSVRPFCTRLYSFHSEHLQMFVQLLLTLLPKKLFIFLQLPEIVKFL